MKYELKEFITPSEVYGNSKEKVLAVVAGYQIIDFRVPQDKELYLPTTLVPTTNHPEAVWGTKAPRFILAPATTMPNERWWE
jgi:hypothetical protein